jgi:hypothetical protein
MPVPVDDSVALAHRNRFAYLVSGWHDTDNVPLVQVYDAVEDRWFEATPYPGSPVFGHSGVIHDGRLLVCDGVRVDRATGRRAFVATDECWLGAIDPLDPARIDWQQAAPHPGPPRYRMAAAARPGKAEAVFVGGSANPYNYDGIGYGGRPAEPERSILLFDFGTGTWRVREDGPATMDHRGLLPREGGFAVVGGMRAGQAVSAGVEVFSID